MNKQVLVTTDSPEVEIDVCCDAKIQGWDRSEVAAESPEGAIDLKQTEGGIAVYCTEDCTVLVPMRARVTVKSIGGDARLKNLANAVKVQTVGGDFVVRNVPGITIESVGGDLSARGVGGEIVAATVGGDFSAREMSGNVSVATVGGDLDLDGAALTALTCNVGGDATVSMLPTGENRYALSAGGDVTLSLAQGASAVVHITDASGPRSLQVGDGQAEVAVTCGGDASVRAAGAEDAAREPREGFGPAGPRPDMADFGDDMARFGEAMGRWGAQFGESMGKWGAQFGESMGSKGGEIGERIARKAEQAAARAARKAEETAARAAERAARHAERAVREAERSAHRGRRGFGFSIDFSRRPPVPPAPERAQPPMGEPVSDDERLTILRMLEQKKITAEQAEQLLKSLS